MDLNSADGKSAAASKLLCQQERQFTANLDGSVIINHIESDGSLWVMLESEFHFIQTISYVLNDEEDGQRKNVSNPAVGDVVSALHGDNTWCRAVIISTEPSVCVRFIDYGDTLVVSPDQLATLPLKLTHIPPIAMKVNLPSNSLIRPAVSASLLVEHISSVDGVAIVDVILPKLNPTQYSDEVQNQLPTTKLESEFEESADVQRFSCVSTASGETSETIIESASSHEELHTTLVQPFPDCLDISKKSESNEQAAEDLLLSPLAPALSGSVMESTSEELVTVEDLLQPHVTLERSKGCVEPSRNVQAAEELLQPHLALQPLESSMVSADSKQMAVDYSFQLDLPPEVLPGCVEASKNEKVIEDGEMHCHLIQFTESTSESPSNEQMAETCLLQTHPSLHPSESSLESISNEHAVVNDSLKLPSYPCSPESFMKSSSQSVFEESLQPSFPFQTSKSATELSSSMQPAADDCLPSGTDMHCLTFQEPCKTSARVSDAVEGVQHEEMSENRCVSSNKPMESVEHQTSLSETSEHVTDMSAFGFEVNVPEGWPSSEPTGVTNIVTVPDPLGAQDVGSPVEIKVCVGPATDLEHDTASAIDHLQGPSLNPLSPVFVAQSCNNDAPGQNVQSSVTVYDNGDTSQRALQEVHFHKPRVGTNGGQQIHHEGRYGSAGDEKPPHPRNVLAPRSITKGRNKLESLSPQAQYLRPSYIGPSRTSAQMDTPQKTVAPICPNDLQSMLQFELAIVREQSRLQLLQLQQRMEHNVATQVIALREEMASFKGEITRQLEVFHSEVNNRLSIINDSLVFKMAEIYSDISNLKNDQEMGGQSQSKSASSGGSTVNSEQLLQYPNSLKMQPLNSYPIGSSDLSHNKHYNQSPQEYKMENGGSVNYPTYFLKERMLEMDKESIRRSQQASMRGSDQHLGQETAGSLIGQHGVNNNLKMDHFDPTRTECEKDVELSGTKTATSSIISVKNLSEKLNLDLLFNLFGTYGNVQKVKMQPDKSRAFIQMENSMQAEKTVLYLDKLPLMGRQMHLSICSFKNLFTTKQDYQSNICKDFSKSKYNRYIFGKWDAQKLFPPSRRLMISNVLNSVPDEKITEEFSKRGFHLQNISSQTCSNGEKKLVFVTLGSVGEAVNALTVMHLQEMSDWMMIRISFARNDKR